MATNEGVYPKAGNDPYYDSEVTNNEIYSILSQNLIQTTRLTQNVSGTGSGIFDIGYNFAQSDIFSDTGGYNNTINASQTTAIYLGSAYVMDGSLYDNFNDNSINFSLWTSGITIGDRGTCDITEVNNQMELISNGTGGGADSHIGSLTSITNFYDYLQWIAKAVTFTANPGANVSVYVNDILITDNAAAAGGTYNDYAVGSWALIKIVGTKHNLYKNKALIRSFTQDFSGLVSFKVGMNTAAAGSANQLIENVLFGHLAGSNLIVTSGAVFNDNIKSMFAEVNTNTSGAGTSVTYDASSDGGSNYQQTTIGIGSWSGELDAGSMGVIKLELNNTGSFTPYLFGYSYFVTD